VIGKEQWAKMLQYHRNEVARFEAFKPSCQTCSHYSVKRTHCAKFNARPPQDVLAEGCVDWDMDNIPF